MELLYCIKKKNVEKMMCVSVHTPEVNTCFYMEMVKMELLIDAIQNKHKYFFNILINFCFNKNTKFFYFSLITNIFLFKMLKALNAV